MSDGLEKTMRILVCTVVGGLLFWLGMKYFLPVLVPFAAAYVVSLAIRPISRRVRAKAPRLDKPVTLFTLLALSALAFWGIWRLFAVAADQLVNLLGAAAGSLSGPDGLPSRIAGFFGDVSAHVPFLLKLGIDGESARQLASVISRVAGDAALRISSDAAGFATGAISSLPSAAVGIIVTLSATFYFSLDRGELSRSMSLFVSDELAQKFAKFRSVAASAVKSYVKTYLLMMLVVFTLVYLGLSVAGVRYALVISLITALVDLLPVLGVGTVLVPWGIAELIAGDFRTAVTLFVILAVVTVVREVIEPRLIGGYIGVHPILALISVYAGMRLFGIAGMISAPILLGIACSVAQAKKENG